LSKTVVGLFDDFTQAQRAVQALESSGIPRNDISLVANNTEGQYDQYAGTALENDVTDSATSGAGTGATAGAVLGGGLGLLAGLGLMASPGFGPIVAAGWIVSTITGAGIGAAAGGVLGALVGAGVPHEEAALYNEGVVRGGTLIAVKTPDDMAGSTADTLSQFGAVNIDERAESYRQPSDAAPLATTPVFNNEFNINSTTLPPAPPMPVPMPATNSLTSDQFQPAANTTAPITTPGYAPFEAIDTSHQRRDALDDTTTGAERDGIQTGGHALDGTPDTRGITEKMADAITGDRIDDKTGKPVR
jgi:hypothetical protein